MQWFALVDPSSDLPVEPLGFMKVVSRLSLSSLSLASLSRLSLSPLSLSPSLTLQPMFCVRGSLLLDYRNLFDLYRTLFDLYSPRPVCLQYYCLS
jgi:hypothetical protein